MAHCLPVFAPNPLLRGVARCVEEAHALSASYSEQLAGLREKLESQTFTLESIASATRRGTEIGSAGTQETDAKARGLSFTIRKLDDLSNRLNRIAGQFTTKKAIGE